MPSTDSGLAEKVDAMPPELVVGMARNGWTASIRITGRHGPDYAADSTVHRRDSTSTQLCHRGAQPELPQRAILQHLQGSQS